MDSAIQKLEQAQTLLEAGKEDEARERLEGAMEQLSGGAVPQVDALRCSGKKGRCIPDEEADVFIADAQAVCGMIDEILWPPPVALFSANPESGVAPLEVSFDGSASYDPDGYIVEFHWTFGDGASASGEIITHVFAEAGNYPVVLQVTDNRGKKSSTQIVVVVEASIDRMYVSNAGSDVIATAQLDGSHSAILAVASLSNPIWMAVDAISRRIYVVNYNGNITVANLDGTGGRSLGVATLNDPRSVALDVEDGKMYVTNEGNDTVTVANLDGTNGTALAIAGLDNPQGIALDVASGRMYIANTGTDTVTVANLDGSNGETLDVATLSKPYGLALDLTSEKMYVVNSDTNSVTVANLDGTGGASLDLGGLLDGPRGIALDLAAGRMYVANRYSHTVVVANLDGTGAIALDLGGKLDTPYSVCLGPSQEE